MKLKWIPAYGEEIDLTPPYFLKQSVEGLDIPPIGRQEQKAPFQDGRTVLNKWLEPREVNLEYIIRGNNNYHLQELKESVLSSFNPDLEKGKLYIELRDGSLFYIEGILESSPIFPDGAGRGNTWQTILITLYCPNPAIKSNIIIEKDMSAWIGGLEFPLVIEPYMQFEEAGDTVDINNYGNLETPVKIEFRGYAVNPKVVNITTGEFIKVDKEIQEDEVLKINTEFGNESVEIVDSEGNRENAYHFIDLDSSLWYLKRGINTISYEADEGQEEAIVKIIYSSRYIGI